MNGDKLIRVSTAAVAVGIAGVAAVVSYRHAYDVVLDHGEPQGTAVLVPLCVDGLVYAAGMVHLDNARRGQKAGALAWLALGLGIGATIAVNVLHGVKAGPVGAVVAAWPAVTLILVVELLMGMIRRARDVAPDADRDATPNATLEESATDAPGDMRRAAEGDAGRDIPRDIQGDIGGDAPRAIEAPKPTTARRRTATKKATAATQGDADRATAARAVLAEEPDISGAALGRRLGLSARQGQRLLSDIRAADPVPGQMALGDDTDRDTDDTEARESRSPVADDAPVLALVGGDR